MEMIKWRTIEWGYHRNSTFLLASLLSLYPVRRHKVIIIYNNKEFDVPNNKRWYVINISRKPSGEYYGFVNSYWK